VKMMFDSELDKLLKAALENEKNVVRTVCHNYLREPLYDEKLHSVVIFHLENFARNIFDLAITKNLIKFDQHPLLNETSEEAEESKMKETFIDYNEENDILTINFHHPPLEAGITVTKGDFIFRSKKGEPIGVTIMNFSRYTEVIRLLSGGKVK